MDSLQVSMTFDSYNIPA